MDLIEGVWNTCSDVLDQWGIGEIEKYLETLMPKGGVEKARVSSEAEIHDLAVLDSKAMHFSIILPTRMVIQVDENAQMAKKGMKFFSSLTIQSHL